MMVKFGRRVIPFLIIVLPCFIYLIYAFSNSGTLFFSDDFHLLKTIVWMKETDSFAEKFSLLIQQHNEHRIIIPRLITLIDYNLEGFINWRSLILLGNLLWMSVIVFFWKAFKDRQLPVWMFIPVPWILFQPQYYDNVTWSISILQQSVIIFWFALLSFLLATRRYLWALPVVIIATFTHGNGIFGFLIGILFLCWERNWKGVIQWIATLFVVATLYFWGFQKGQNADFGNSLSDPVRLMMAFFAFFGAVARLVFANPTYAAAAGFTMIAILAIYLIPKLRFDTEASSRATFFDRLLLANVFFLGITAALVCVSRSWAGVDNVLAPRYQHYSPFLLCWAYLVLLRIADGTSRKILAIAFLTCGIVFNGLCYFVYNEEVAFRKDWLTADGTNWNNHKAFLSYRKSFNHNIADPYSKAEALGICLKSASLEAPLPNAAPTDSSIVLNVSRTIIEDRDATGVFPREQMRVENKTLTGNTFLYLQAGKQKGYWLPGRISRTSTRELILRQKIKAPGFSVEFVTENLPAGEYQMGVLNNNRFSWTKKRVTIDN